MNAEHGAAACVLAEHGGGPKAKAEAVAPGMAAASTILLRTHRFGAREQAFAARLRADTGYDVVILADESRGVVDTGVFPKVVISPEAMRDLGLRCPPDFAWRCGDYGFYAARRALPQVEQFWMVEPDVRFSGAGYGTLFALLDGVAADFLAPHLAQADRGHFWYPTMRWLTPQVYRCGFALCRISAGAVDVCLAERRRLSGLWQARLMWPNDESFVATTLMRLGRHVRDLNEAGIVCTQASFGFAAPHRGEAIEAMKPDGLIYHPVLWGEDYARKTQRIARGVSVGETVRLKILRGLVRLQSASAHKVGAHKLGGSQAGPPSPPLPFEARH